MDNVHQRTIGELAESVQYGKLYRVIKLLSNGKRLLVVRYRRDGKKGQLYPDKSEKLILERIHGTRETRIGDMWFVDNMGDWSLLQIRAAEGNANET